MYSYVIPFHDDYEKVIEVVNLLLKEREERKIDQIILSHNGTKLSREVEEKLTCIDSNCVFLHSNIPGIGSGYRIGILESKSPYTVLSASDLPFGFSDIENFNKVERKPSLAIGSKWITGSRIEGYSLKRVLSSKAFYFLRYLILGGKTPKDSQGTIIVKTGIAKKLIESVQSNDYFFSLELITFALSKKVDIQELPVVLENHSSESSVSIGRDGIKMCRKLFDLRRKIRK